MLGQPKYMIELLQKVCSGECETYKFYRSPDAKRFWIVINGQSYSLGKNGLASPGVQVCIVSTTPQEALKFATGIVDDAVLASVGAVNQPATNSNGIGRFILSVLIGLMLASCTLYILFR